MANAAAGANKNAKALFDKLGISLRNADGSLRSTTDVMGDLTVAFEKNTNGALRTNMAMTLLGKSGADLIPLLAMGKEGIAGFNDEMERYGLVLSDAEIKKAAELGDNFDRLKAAFGGMRMKVGAALSDSFSLMAESLAKAFAQVSTNAPLMERLGTTAESVAAAITSVDWPKFINGVLDATAGTIDFVNQIGGVKTLAKARPRFLAPDAAAKSPALAKPTRVKLAALTATPSLASPVILKPTAPRSSLNGPDTSL